MLRKVLSAVLAVVLLCTVFCAPCLAEENIDWSTFSSESLSMKANVLEKIAAMNSRLDAGYDFSVGEALTYLIYLEEYALAQGIALIETFNMFGEYGVDTTEDISGAFITITDLTTTIGSYGDYIIDGSITANTAMLELRLLFDQLSASFEGTAE